MNEHPAKTDRQCERCGAFEAVEMGEKFLCKDCITEAGCSCNEGDDANNLHQGD